MCTCFTHSLVLACFYSYIYIYLLLLEAHIPSLSVKYTLGLVNYLYKLLIGSV